jgi:hypothetical protein
MKRRYRQEAPPGLLYTRSLHVQTYRAMSNEEMVGGSTTIRTEMSLTPLNVAPSYDVGKERLGFSRMQRSVNIPSKKRPDDYTVKGSRE